MRRALSIALLAGAILGFGLTLDHIHRTPVDTSPIASRRFTTDDLPRDLPFLGPPLADSTPEAFSQIVGRPLFWASRRPIIQPPAPRTEPLTVPSEPVSVRMRLAGIVHVGETRRRALLVWPDQPAGQWLDEGADLDGWRLLRIDRFGVQVGAGSRIERLDLH